MTVDGREELEERLFNVQNGLCYICEQPVDRDLQKREIDHIIPRARGGKDEPNNLALTHEFCNRSKSASNLKVARALAKFTRLREQALTSGKRGANLGDILEHHGGGQESLKLRCQNDTVELSLSEVGRLSVQKIPLFLDKLSGVQSFFVSLPLAYLHHDDRINPRDIGRNLRGLIERVSRREPSVACGACMVG